MIQNVARRRASSRIARALAMALVASATGLLVDAGGVLAQSGEQIGPAGPRAPSDPAEPGGDPYAGPPQRKSLLCTRGKGGLFIGGAQIDPNSPEDDERVIRFLTVSASRQDDPAFASGRRSELARIESPLRRQILCAMASNPYPVRFANLEEAKENFAIRIEMIRFMNAVATKRVDATFVSGSASPPRIGPYFGFDHWAASSQALRPGQRAPGGRVLNTKPGASASSAVVQFRHASSRLDCLDGIELTILQSVEKVIGAKRFDDQHPEGLKFIGLNFGKDDWNDSRISILRHIEAANPDVSDYSLDSMIPGDWVYLQNIAIYAQHNPEGGFRGENAVYMGRYQPGFAFHGPFGGPATKLSEPVYRAGEAPRFSGLGGEFDRTETELRGDMAVSDRSAVVAEVVDGILTGKPRFPNFREMRWSRVFRPKAGNP
jgi:hypothetical protein